MNRHWFTASKPQREALSDSYGWRWVEYREDMPGTYGDKLKLQAIRTGIVRHRWKYASEIYTISPHLNCFEENYCKTNVAERSSRHNNSRYTLKTSYKIKENGNAAAAPTSKSIRHICIEKLAANHPSEKKKRTALACAKLSVRSE